MCLNIVNSSVRKKVPSFLPSFLPSYLLACLLAFGKLFIVLLMAFPERGGDNKKVLFIQSSFSCSLDKSLELWD